MARPSKPKPTRTADKATDNPLDWFHDAASFEARSDAQKEQVSARLNAVRD